MGDRRGADVGQEKDKQNLVAGGGPGGLNSLPGFCLLLPPLLCFFFILHSCNQSRAPVCGLMTATVTKNCNRNAESSGRGGGGRCLDAAPASWARPFFWNPVLRSLAALFF